MKDNKLFLVIFLLALFSCKKENTTTDNLLIGNLSISPSKLMPGKTATVNYLGKDSITESIYYYMVKNKMFPLDVNFSKEKLATITIPDSAQAIAFQFKKENGYDNNKEQGYLIPLVDKNGNEILGANASLANFSISYHGKNQGIKKDLDSVLLDLKYNMDKHPEIKDTWNIMYLKHNYNENKKSGKSLILKQVNTFIRNQNATEEDYKQAVSLCNTIRDKAMIDSITAIAISKYPNSDFAKNTHTAKFFNEKDADKQLQIFDEIGHNFSKQYQDYALLSIVRKQIKKQDLNTISKYDDKISNKSSLASIYNNTAWDLVKKNENLEFAEQISKKSLDLIQSLKEDKKSKPDYLTENQYKKSLLGNHIMYTDTYAWILFKNGNIKDAIKHQESVTKKINVGANDKHKMKARYIEYLLADNQFEKAQNKAEEYIKNADANSSMEELIKKAFSKNTGSLQGFDSYFAILKSQSDEIELREIKKKMLDEVAQDFKLKNLKGEDITLSDFKGKTIILDFWATWCGPCKASFPGMQKAVNKYEDNIDVAFLFIDTRERGSQEDIKQNALSFLSKNKYSFNVLLDNKANEDSEDFKMVTDYNVGGIPTKIIIGPDGKIKFRSVGFSGNTDGLVKELDIMIKLAQS